MGELIPFPKPKIKLTEEETEKYWEIKRNIERAKTMRDIRYCRKQVKEFIKTLKERCDKEMDENF